ncbi:MAG: hypothetical protein F4103_15230 [Boseongicola sp. SB0673_bin_14]|nr:hypothetical protein [Boseongicola sp. SB0667_bin_21]MYI70024.1 hypothetical protein [Boseongicola sp. SB0673_bin_14]
MANNRPRLVRASVPGLEGAPPHPTQIKARGIDPVVNPGDRTLWSTLDRAHLGECRDRKRLLDPGNQIM